MKESAIEESKESSIGRAVSAPETKPIKSQEETKEPKLLSNKGKLQVIVDDPYLAPFESDLILRRKRYQE